jgi:hypothetical protein
MLYLIYPNQKTTSTRANYKFMHTTNLSQTKNAHFLPKLTNQSTE